MAFGNKILTSIFGRRLGLQALSSAESGGSGRQEFLVGPEDIRREVTTAETTSTNLKAHGISFLTAGTSSVFTLSPPIPGVSKSIIASTAGPSYVKTANSETFVTSMGSSFTTIKASSLGAVFELIGLTTAIWGALNVTSGTSSNASAFTLTTST